MKKKIILIVASIFVVVALVAGVTYAFYSANVNRINESQTVVKTNNLTLTYTGGQEINVSGIVPGDSFTKTFTVENTSNIAVDYNIYLENITNEFNEDLVYTLSDETGNVIEESILPVSNIGKTYLSSSISINANTTKNYTLKITFKHSNENQNDLQGKIFSATLGIDTIPISPVQILNDKIDISNLTETQEITKEFNIYNPTNNKQKYNLMLSDIVNDYGNNLTYTLKRDGEVVVAETAMPTSDTKILSGVKIDANATHSYEMIIKYTSTVGNSNAIKLLANEKFNANIKLEIIDMLGVMPLTEYVRLLFESNDSSLQKDNTSDANIRYVGENPNNYIKIGNEVYRIIGSMNNIQLADNSGSKTLIKVVRKDSVTNMKWDVNNKNDWNNSTIKDYLNTTYLTSLGNLQNQIANVRWQIGLSSIGNGNIVLTFYNKEKDNSYIYNGKIALPSVSDYGYSSPSDCWTEKMSYYRCCTTCKDRNWQKSTGKWFLDRYSGYAAWYSNTSWDPTYGNASSSFNVFPAFYLKAEVEKVNGTGTINDPFIIE